MARHRPLSGALYNITKEVLIMAIGGLYQVKNPMETAMRGMSRAAGKTKKDKDEEKRKKAALKAESAKAGVLGGAAIGALNYLAG